MDEWTEAKTKKAKLKLLFQWIKENDNSKHEKIGDTQKMTPAELVDVYGSQIICPKP